jgi:hypothetical protein
MELKIFRVRLRTRVVWVTKWYNRKQLKSGSASLSTMQRVKLGDRLSRNLVKKELFSVELHTVSFCNNTYYASLRNYASTTCRKLRGNG